MLAIQSIVLGAADHGHEAQLCGCAQYEPDHPFTIDCTDVATINAASALLDGACKEPNAYEWGGTFATPEEAALDKLWSDDGYQVLRHPWEQPESENGGGTTLPPELLRRGQ
mgnify:CR=1 FL=1